MLIQYIIISIIVLASLSYAGKKLYEIFRHQQDKCYGCSGCTIHDQLMKQKEFGKLKPTCYHKK